VNERIVKMTHIGYSSLIFEAIAQKLSGLALLFKDHNVKFL